MIIVIVIINIIAAAEMLLFWWWKEWKEGRKEVNRKYIYLKSSILISVWMCVCVCMYTYTQAQTHFPPVLWQMDEWGPGKVLIALFYACGLEVQETF